MQQKGPYTGKVCGRGSRVLRSRHLPRIGPCYSLDTWAIRTALVASVVREFFCPDAAEQWPRKPAPPTEHQPGFWSRRFRGNSPSETPELKPGNSPGGSVGGSPVEQPGGSPGR